MSTSEIRAASAAVTRQRINRLRKYMEVNVMGPQGFCCSSEAACRGSIKPGYRFDEGTLPHVGHHYDLNVDGNPLRVVVVGRESGLHDPFGRGRHSSVSLEDRYEIIHGNSGLQSRYYADGIHGYRNPHMRGTTSALRVLFGKGLGVDWENEFMATDRERFHVFDAFALVNFLLCATGPEGTSQGKSSPTMRRRCLRHFEATLRVLEPTILVLQGVRNWIAPLLGEQEVLDPHLSRIEVAGQSVLMCDFSHPSAHPPLRWGANLDAPYLVQVVEPTLRRAVAEL